MLDGLTIDRNCGKPVSLQIAQFVKGRIAKNEFGAGDKFPTTQEFVKIAGVGPHTVRQAMKHLEQEGLVRCTPRLGTVICESAFDIVHDNGAQQPSQNGTTEKQIRRIAMFGLLQNIGNGRSRYCVETAEGITAECERLGVMQVVLPLKVAQMSARQIYEQLRSVDCEALIWAHSGMPEDEDTFDYLESKGVKVIFKRRSQLNDGRPCIDADYDAAGYKTGQYFHENGIKSLLVFSHFDFNTANSDLGLHGYPTHLKSGIVRAYESNYIKPDIEVNVYCNEDERTSRQIYGKLCQTPHSTGVIFTNGYQLLNYLAHNGLQGYEQLLPFKTVAISNLTINYQLRPYVRGLDLMVLVDNFKESGKLLVGNLMGMLEGYLESGTTTLVGVDFLPFEKSFNQ